MAIKHLRQEYFDLILSGKKKVEGRLNREFWSELKENSEFYFGDDNNNKIKVKVIGITKVFKDFGSLYDLFGEKLLPNIATREEAIKIYHGNEIIKGIYTEKEIKEHGIIGIHFEVIE